ncbi:MAG: hypothetical protein WC533_02240 [Candidatus Pacearchaeota archaeon]
MKILIFLHGTIIMHKSGIDKSRKQRVEQSVRRESSVLDYVNYVPVGNSVEKLQNWKKQGFEIIYLSSHESFEDVQKDKLVLKKFKFPKGEVVYRKKGEEYKDVAERISPDILIEDDCESIGGKSEMTITYINPKIKIRIKSIVVKEFSGIDNLPDNLRDY